MSVIKLQKECQLIRVKETVTYTDSSGTTANWVTWINYKCTFQSKPIQNTKQTTSTIQICYKILHTNYISQKRKNEIATPLILCSDGQPLPSCVEKKRENNGNSPRILKKVFLGLSHLQGC